MGIVKIKSKIDNLAKFYNLPHQTLWDMFFFENYLNRIANSKYSIHLCLKVGFC